MMIISTEDTCLVLTRRVCHSVSRLFFFIFPFFRYLLFLSGYAWLSVSLHPIISFFHFHFMRLFMRRKSTFLMQGSSYPSKLNRHFQKMLLSHLFVIILRLWHIMRHLKTFISLGEVVGCKLKYNLKGLLLLRLLLLLLSWWYLPSVTWLNE